MSYSITLSGHGADPDDVKDVFEDVVRALRTIGDEKVGGTLSASDDDGSSSVSLAADDVDDAVELTDAAELEPDAEAGDQATDVGSTDAPAEI